MKAKAKTEMTLSHKGWSYGGIINPEKKYVWVVWPISREYNGELKADTLMMKAFPTFAEAIDRGLELMAMWSYGYESPRKKYSVYYNFEVNALEVNL